jgi:DNA-binding NarL/FixJ family response regulator
MLSKDAKIMIVDDAPIMREALRRVLAVLGYTNIVQAEHGKSALFILEKNDYKIDFVFLDIVMPFMDGKATLRKIREKSKTLPVLMLTSVADADAIDECTKEGISGYVLKPVNAENGTDIITEIFAKL